MRIAESLRGGMQDVGGSPGGIGRPGRVEPAEPADLVGGEGGSAGRVVVQRLALLEREPLRRTPVVRPGAAPTFPKLLEGQAVGEVATWAPVRLAIRPGT